MALSMNHAALCKNFFAARGMAGLPHQVFVNPTAANIASRLSFFRPILLEKQKTLATRQRQAGEATMVEMTFGTRAGGIRASHEMPRCAMAAGSTVLTLMGAVPVEYVAPGDRVITRNGARNVRAVQISVVKSTHVICISEGVLDTDRPEQDICLSPDQPILIRDWRAKAMAAARQAVVPAARLVDGEYVRRLSCDEVWMISLQFDTDEVIYANGLELLCEAAATPG